MDWRSFVGHFRGPRKAIGAKVAQPHAMGIDNNGDAFLITNEIQIPLKVADGMGIDAQRQDAVSDIADKSKWLISGSPCKGSYGQEICFTNFD
ncbi:hypothetical protein PENSUB_12538 [Penicillium subrubescens]|uniref:Uncharacterized protein n=1 Tax=Penicillium subrubescens TaxID=1316194 RepID=A0A1Q5SYR6_9EURO|nr:hypothetical protein PENSUB_12538 [Penicillium subrubescens]